MRASNSGQFWRGNWLQIMNNSVWAAAAVDHHSCVAMKPQPYAQRSVQNPHSKVD